MVFGDAEEEDDLIISGYEYQLREAGADWPSTWDSSQTLVPFTDDDIGDSLFSFTYGSLTNGTTYEFRVRATTMDTDGEVGAVGEIATASGTPRAVMLTAGRIDMTASGSEIQTCGATFSDGPGQYENHRLLLLTLAPDTPGTKISVTFTSFQLDDFLGFYDGGGATSPADREDFATGELLDITITSTSDDGKLTFQFYSDEEGTDEGWEATVYCVGAGSPYIELAPQDSQILALWQVREPVTGHTITGYEYQWRTAEGGAAWGATWRRDWTPIDVGDSQKGFLFDDLTNGRVYELRVRAITSNTDGMVFPGGSRYSLCSSGGRDAEHRINWHDSHKKN